MHVISESTWGLLLPSLLLVAELAIPRRRLRWPLWRYVALRIATFAVLTVLVTHSMGSPLAPRFGSSDAARQLWQQIIEAG